MPFQFKDELAVPQQIVSAYCLHAAAGNQGMELRLWRLMFCSCRSGEREIQFNNLPRGSFLLGGKAELAGKAPFEFHSCLNPLQTEEALL